MNTKTNIPQNISLYTAGIAVDLYAQAVKTACFTEGAVIYSHSYLGYIL